MDHSELAELDELRARVQQLEAMLVQVPGDWSDINELLVLHEQRLEIAAEGNLMERFKRLLKRLTGCCADLERVRGSFALMVAPAERSLSITPVAGQSPEGRVEAALRQLISERQQLRKELNAAMQSLANVREVEWQTNLHQGHWTHTDRRAIADLVVRIIDARLERLAYFRDRSGSDRLQGIHTDAEF